MNSVLRIICGLVAPFALAMPLLFMTVPLRRMMPSAEGPAQIAACAIAAVAGFLVLDIRTRRKTVILAVVYVPAMLAALLLFAFQWIVFITGEGP